MNWRSLTMGILSCLCAFPALSRPDSLAQENSIPVRINDYYKAGNFVVAFSTADERAQLAVSAPDTSAYRFGGRLEEVRRKLQILIGSELRYDKGVSDETPGMPYLANQFSVPVKVIQQDGNRLVLLVQTYEVPYEAPLSFAASGRSRAEPEVTLRPKMRACLEVHEWIQTRGQWFRRPDNVRMLSSVPVPVDTRVNI